MDYTLCGCHPLPPVDPSPLPPRKNSNSIGRQLSKLVGVMKLKLSRSSSSEGKGGAGKEIPFDTLKTFGRSAMLCPPRPLSSSPPTPTSTAASPPSAKRKEGNGKKKSGEHPVSVQEQHPHPDVFAGSHPSNHDAVRYTARSHFFWRAKVVEMYSDERKEKRVAWEKEHLNLGDGKGKEKKKERVVKVEVEEDMNVEVEVDVGTEGVNGGHGHGHPHLGCDAAGNEVPPWGVFLLPVPIHFENGNENGNGGRDLDQDRSCVSVDANQVKMMGGCASVSIGLLLLHFGTEADVMFWNF